MTKYVWQYWAGDMHGSNQVFCFYANSAEEFYLNILNFFEKRQNPNLNYPDVYREIIIDGYNIPKDAIINYNSDGKPYIRSFEDCRILPLVEWFYKENLYNKSEK